MYYILALHRKSSQVTLERESERHPFTIPSSSLLLVSSSPLPFPPSHSLSLISLICYQHGHSCFNYSATRAACNANTLQLQWKIFSSPLRLKRLHIALLFFQLLIILHASSSPSSMIKTWIETCWKFRGSFSVWDRRIFKNWNREWISAKMISRKLTLEKEDKGTEA